MIHTTLVTPAMLAAHLDHPGWVVIDCRFSLADPAAGERAYREGHIPGARYAHLDRDLAAPVTPVSGRHPLPAPEWLAVKLGVWGVAADSQVVVYDDAGGAFAARLWWLLRWLGHAAVAVLDGGLPRWRREGRPVTDALPQVAAVTFTPRTALGQAVTVERLQRELAAGEGVVLDARAPARFRGEVEPIDPVAGHVPGARNRPLQDNLDGQACFLAAGELRRQFHQVLGATRPEQVVHMCGSGVTACHNLLAMEHAGLPGSRLYAGSWSEWIRDPARPVARGRRDE